MILEDLSYLPTGAMIRAARGLVGVEVRAFAAAIGVTPKTVFAVERDISTRPDERRLKIVRRMRDYFVDECCVTFLFEQDGLGVGVRFSTVQLDAPTTTKSHQDVGKDL